MPVRATPPFGLLLAVLLVVPATATAVSVRDIIKLTEGGVPEAVLLELIDADRTVYTLDADELLRLQAAGVSEAVLLKMIRSRREFEDAGSATSSTLSPTAAAAPHDPAPVPSGGAMSGPGDRRRAAPVPVMPVILPYYVGVPVARQPAQTAAPPEATPKPVTGRGGFGRFINDGWIDER